MERVTGIGGIFFKTQNPEALADWYRKNLGMCAAGEHTEFEWREKDRPEQIGRTVWSLFNSDTDYFGPGSQQDLAATAGDRVFFDYDQADIKPEGQETLRRQAEWLRRYSNVAVTIEGHCDERGTREYNLALGERRAQAVKNVLVALGIPAGRIQTISYGKERPEIPHSDDSSYAQNRRGVTTVN